MTPIDTSPENVAMAYTVDDVRSAVNRLRLNLNDYTADMLEALAAERDALAARVAELDVERDAARETLMNAGIALHVAKREATDAEAKLAASEALVERLREALDNLVACQGEDPCYYDHHGYCQAHYIEADCSVAKARAALEETKP
jgi:chromosome segregation ATPase